MVIILMENYGMELQEAMDYVGEMCRVTMVNFIANKSRVPSFGDAQLDKDVAGYVQGLQDWIVGALHWSFMSQRYFGTEGAEIKKHRYVKLLPKREEVKTQTRPSSEPIVPASTDSGAELKVIRITPGANCAATAAH